MATIGGPVIAMIYEAFMSNALRREQHQTPPIAFIIDELGQIPAMPVISMSAALMRGYNCSIMLSCQSLSMIEKHYGREGRKELMDCVKAHGFFINYEPRHTRMCVKDDRYTERTCGEYFSSKCIIK